MDLIKESHIAFVNLDHRTDRLEHMNTQLSRLGLNAVRVRGLLPAECQHKKRIETMMKRTPGAVGCHFSQVSIMERALSEGKHAWVMEDDLIFCQDFLDRVVLFNGFLQGRDWDVLWLGGTFHAPVFWHRIGKSGMPPDCSAQLGKDYEHTDDPRFKKTYGAFCTYAYIVNHKSIEKILSLFDTHIHTSIGIDWLFIKLQPQLNCFAFVPGSVKQMDNMSDIGTGMTIFSGFSRLNGTEENSRYWYQENINDFNPETFEWK